MKPIFFASDFHLGLDVIDYQSSDEREKVIVSWLEDISKEVGILHLVGDIFDYWFEYKHIIPKGFTRILGTLSKMNDAGWEIHYHTGNHDMWVGNYFESEFGAIMHRSPIEAEYHGRTFYIGHGDGLGDGDYGYKIIKKIFSSRINQWLFSMLHPNIGISIMKYISKKSRMTHLDSGNMEDKSKEILLTFAQKHQIEHNLDFYIFGHRHLPAIVPLEKKSTFYINLGDWLKFCTYLKFDGKNIELKAYKNAHDNQIQN